MSNGPNQIMFGPFLYDRCPVLFGKTEHFNMIEECFESDITFQLIDAHFQHLLSYTQENNPRYVFLSRKDYQILRNYLGCNCFHKSNP